VATIVENRRHKYKSIFDLAKRWSKSG
jgi:hypothetical protein